MRLRTYHGELASSSTAHAVRTARREPPSARTNTQTVPSNSGAKAISEIFMPMKNAAQQTAGQRRSRFAVIAATAHSAGISANVSIAVSMRPELDQRRKG